MGPDATSENFFFYRTSPTTYRPTQHAEGAWSSEDYHFAALAGLMVHCLEQWRSDYAATQESAADKYLSRVSFDILGRLPLGEVEITVAMRRPGRSIELLEATCSAGGRELILARAWYLQAFDSADAAGTEYPDLPLPEQCPPVDMSAVWGGGFIKQLECREARAAQPGSGARWINSPNKLVHGDDPVAIAEYVCRIDVANGISPRRLPEEWAFPNVDMTIHLFRQPDPTWTGLDTTVSWGPQGSGLTSSTLYDIHGVVGKVEQSLTLRAQTQP